MKKEDRKIINIKEKDYESFILALVERKDQYTIHLSMVPDDSTYFGIVGKIEKGKEDEADKLTVKTDDLSSVVEFEIKNIISAWYIEDSDNRYIQLEAKS